MADEHIRYTSGPNSDRIDEISDNPLEETLLSDEGRRAASSVTSSTHGPYLVHCISRVKDLPSNMENFFPPCQCMETTENIVAFIWGSFILFIGIIFVVAQFNMHLKAYSFTTTYWALSTFMLVAIVAMMIAIQNRKNKNFADNEIDESDDYSPERYSRYLIVNIYVFSVGSFLLDMFAILTVFHCGLGEAAQNSKIKYAAKCVYHAIRLVFTATQLSFLQIFTKEKIRRRYHLPYKLLLAHVMVTNFLVWFSFLCQETGILNKSTYEPKGEYEVLNCTSSIDNGVFAIAKSVTTYLTPFILEFSLLAASMFYSLFPFKIINNDEPDHRRKYNYGAIDPVKRDNSKIYRSQPALLAGILIGLLLILSSWTLEDKTHYIYNLRFSYAMQILVHVFIMVASIMVFKEMRQYHTKRYQTLKYRMDDYLLLLTGIGGFLPFLFMVLFAVFKVKEYVQEDFVSHGVNVVKKNLIEIRTLLCVLAIFNVTSVLTQTFALLNARSYKRVPFSYKPRADSSIDLNDVRNNYTKLRSSARIGQWLILLLFLNLSLWIVTSTFELDHGIRTTYFIPSAYWSRKVWTFITRLLYPVLIFYRIHSVAMIAYIWMSFRIKKKVT